LEEVTAKTALVQEAVARWLKNGEC
jgi:hypothetical protein